MKFKSDIEVQAGLRDGGNDIGTAGQLLSSTGAVTNWIDQGDVVVGEADKAKSVTLRVKNSTASPMTKGQVICEAVSGTPPSGNLIEVALADNNGANKMPALGILNEDLDASGGNNDEGDAIMFGKVSGINTSSFSVGSEVFVSDVPGGLTITKPTGVKYIQKVGVVIRDDNTNGTIEVFGAGRVNDVPTPLYVDHANQRLGIGAGNPTQKLDIRDGELVFTSSNTNQNPSGRIRFNEYSTSQVSGAYMEYDGSSNVFSMFTNDTFNDYEFLRANRNSHLLLQPNGNRVGIGTTSPSEKLVVRNGTSNTGVKILAYNSALGTEATLKFSTIASETNYEKAAIIARNAAGSFGRSDMHFALDSAPDTGNVQFSDTKMTILNGGNVGIGTTNPTKGLEVAGHVLLKNATFSYLYLQNTSNFLYGDNFGNTIIRSANNFRIQTQINGGESVRVNSSGNVGINTTDPKTRLHVASANGSDTPTAGTATGGLFVSNTNKTYGINMGVSGSGWSFIQNQRADGNTTLYNLNLQPLGGNVGIGTTSPDVKLEVESTASASGIRIKNTSTGYASLDIESNRVTGDNIGGLRYKKTGQAKSQAEINYVTGTRLDFLLGNGTAALTNKLSILENGNVGINDNTPSYKLDVAGTGRFTDILRSDKLLQIPGAGTTANEAKGIGLNATEDFPYVGNDSTTRYLNHYGMGIHKPLQASLGGGNGAYLSGYFGVDIFTAGNSRIHVNQNGNVGIATTSPQAKLHVANGTLRTWTPTSGTSAIFESTVSNRNFVTLTAANEAELWFGNAATQAKGRVRYEMANNTMEFWTNAAERMTINSIGNVGINGAPSTTTSTKLKVYGTITSTGGSGFQIENGYGNPRLGDFYGSFTTTHPLYVGSPYSGLACHASAFNITSDYRLKENEAPLTKAFSRIKKLKPIRFNYIDSENTVDGFLAHEVAEVIPEAVTGEKDAIREDGSDELQGLDLSKIVPLLTAALQESITKIEKLEQRIQTLENK